MTTNQPKRTALALIVACWLLLLGVPLSRQLEQGHLGLWTWSNTASGTAGIWELDHRLLAALDGFERRLEEGSYLLGRALPWVQEVLTAWGGVGNEQVYLGQDGWLIYRPGFDYLFGPPFLDPGVLERRRRATPSWQPVVEPDPRPALFDLARQLGERGIRLLVLPVPTKPSIHPEALAPEVELSAPAQNPSFDAFCAELEASGISVFDPAPLLFGLARQEAAFLQSDSHWSPSAVDVVAAALADWLGELGLVAPEGPPRWSRHNSKIMGRGDLGRLLRLPEGKLKRGLPVLEETVEVAVVADRTGRLWRSDRRAEGLLLGDSFTNVYSVSELGWGSGGGLAEQLAFYLQSPVDRLAIQDGSATEIRRRLAAEIAGGRDRLRGKRWVVYQIAVRELAVGDWQRVELGAPRSPENR